MKLIKQLQESLNQLGELPKDIVGVVKANQKDLMGIKFVNFIDYIHKNTKLRYSEDTLKRVFNKHVIRN